MMMMTGLQFTRMFETYVPTHPRLHHLLCHVIENHVSNLLSSQAASMQEEFEFPNLESLCADTYKGDKNGAPTWSKCSRVL